MADIKLSDVMSRIESVIDELSGGGITYYKLSGAIDVFGFKCDTMKECRFDGEDIITYDIGILKDGVFSSLRGWEADRGYDINKLCVPDALSRNCDFGSGDPDALLQKADPEAEGEILSDNNESSEIDSGENAACTSEDDNSISGEPLLSSVSMEEIKPDGLDVSVDDESSYVPEYGVWMDAAFELPSCDDIVLCIVNGAHGNNRFVNAYEFGSYDIISGWFFESYPDAGDLSVSHWMRLPDFPGTSDNGNTEENFVRAVGGNGPYGEDKEFFFKKDVLGKLFEMRKEAIVKRDEIIGLANAEYRCTIELIHQFEMIINNK